jgi:hypothetical protein
LLLNVAYFGIVGSGMACGAWNREHRDAHEATVRQQAAQVLPVVFNAYRGGHVATAIALTLAINLCLGSFVVITLPSLVVPFAGLLMGAVRAFEWCYIFTPDFGTISATALASGALTWLLLLLEGEGYVLAMLGAYIYGRTFLFPRSAGLCPPDAGALPSRWQGYKFGTARAMQLYPLVAAVLLVAAIYEAVLVIFLKPLLH